MNDPHGPVLITGAAGGIGAATAARLAADGMTVYATARRPEALRALEDAGCRTLRLDVTDEESMRTVVREVTAEHGGLGALVNNAGYGAYGAVEEVPPEQLRAQFETNVFGLVRLTQLVLPHMREAGRGRIVNISSMGGRLVFPLGGAYHASKYAVEAFSDALRHEVTPFGISVSLVEPGLIRTGFGATAGDTLAAATSPRSPYRPLADSVERRMTRTYGSALAAGPEPVARTVHRALTARRPRHRYVVTPAARALIHTRRLLGSRAWDAYLRRQFRTPATTAR
ncbi:oxidoreductase [Streptomyces sp. DSM 42041]|uniref:Oxidoreductase n=1 Tax=Streptomyces hazeniae TaxID=3075538 RepID=A0ABU2NRN6_9ACTN|nr:oxidoreductase [Streptomyces sp. DSM 42041]MDT0379251.1 oxidoreductase [Streptomyces sp. DSM 42041]